MSEQGQRPQGQGGPPQGGQTGGFGGGGQGGNGGPGGGGQGGQGGGQSGGKKPGGQKKPRTFTFVYTPAQLGSRVAGVCIVVVWVFVLGVILGRGFAPENHIPELQKLMPAASGGTPPRVIAPDTKPETAQGEDILSAEELAYRESLKNPAAQTRTAPPQSQTRQPAAEQPAQTRQAAQQTAQTSPQTTQADKPASADSQVYIYVYQVAAYKSAGASDQLAAKLKKDGLNAYTEKSESNGSTWYKTMVTYRGTPDDIDFLRVILNAHKLERLIQRSKTPVK